MSEFDQDSSQPNSSGLFSEVKTPEVRPGQSWSEQLVGIFTEPSSVFKRLHDAPNWVGAFVLFLAAGLLATLIWAHKVDQESLIRHNFQTMQDAFHLPENEVALQTQIDAIHGQPYLKSGLGMLITVPIFFLILSGILLAFAKLGGEDDRVGFKHAWAVTIVHNLAVIPIMVLSGLMCLLRPVGGAASYASLNPVNLAFFLKPENPWIKGVLSALDIFYIFSFVTLFFGLKYTLRMKPWATATVLGITGFFGFIFHIFAGIF